ncbi:hypothetical protein [Micromonospora tarensis]|uniref:Integral membrane protein n=1 Tax=Micromonospora tarensis TaxID=2806100 RepID=A0ABS1YBJ8_9ACTN|nr:hypothetical protein [Micromonospora tarensis]MBM0274775.1 hypothetical protein [Micromonospora tarensis]
MSDLEGRYRLLLRLYPGDYRRVRGEEILGTYLDLANLNRRWPSVADAADLLAGAVRERLRAAGASDLIPGVRLAAALAFVTATGLAGLWAGAEQITANGDRSVPTFGPFATIGIVVWVAWLLVAAVDAVAGVRWTRLAIVLALVLTAAVVPVADLVGMPRPRLFHLVPQATLGLLALALLAHRPRWQRIVTLPTALGVGLSISASLAGRGAFSYRWDDGGILLTYTGVALLAVAVLTAAVLSLRGDARGLWATLVLLIPIGLLSLGPLSALTSDLVGANYPALPVIAGTAVAVVLGSAGSLAVAVAACRRGTTRGPLGDPEAAPATSCPTCGR